MKTRMLIFRPDVNEPEEREVEVVPGEFESIRGVVEELVTRKVPHTYMEHVSVLYQGQRRDMFVDEMGAYPGMELPVNPAATEIYYEASRARGIKHFEGAAQIHGCAVLFPDVQVWL